MIVLLNDTSLYHNGSAEVVKNIDYDIGITVPEDKLSWEGVTEVILNGEGTMHHDNLVAYRWLNMLREAQEHRIPTSVINTVWQQMNKSCAKVLKKCWKVEVRELLSYLELQRYGVRASIVPDRSIRTDVRKKKYPHERIYWGQGFNDNLSGNPGYPEIDIFTQSWNEIVNRLRNADLLVTGRHHEMYAAIKANCRFIVKPGNSWKNLGCIRSASADLPEAPSMTDVLDGKWDEEYDKIFKWANW